MKAAHPAVMVLLAGALVLPLPFVGWHVAAWADELDWVEAAGRVVAATPTPAGMVVNNQCRGSNVPYEVRVAYAFEVDGEQYESSQYDYQEEGEIVCGGDEASDRADWYRAQVALPIFYDPQDPTQSVIQPAEASVVYVLGPLWILGASYLGFSLVQYRRRKRAHAAAEA